ncbi:hypothetical protein DWY76_06795 [Faecalibacterium sp. AF27-11BH]|nr:hypothetical protein DWY76_06795 [Faecalibacterium sp. AF27-11BH]
MHQIARCRFLCYTGSAALLSILYGLRLPASASCLERHSHPTGRGPNSSSLFPPLAAVVAVAQQR